MSLLSEVRAFERTKSQMIEPKERPVFHLSPITGWLNDPNGFSYYNGKYHLFYQYDPYSTQWNYAMKWGHWTSEDLVSWTWEECAMVPDKEYESGCYSGSAITAPDGRHLLMYTAHYEENGERHETQCLAWGDGTAYEKDARNPVLGFDQMPESGFREDFRDPKLWMEDGRYHVVLANRLANGKGAILQYSSEDAASWQYEGILYQNEAQLGDMWECPDFFALDGHHVLNVSVMAMQTNDPKFKKGWGTISFVGAYDKASKSLTDVSTQALDLGFDFYAPQSMTTPDGRQVLVAWMQAPEESHAPQANKWYGQMTFPRELSVRNHHLYQTPAREIEQYYGASAEQELTGTDAWLRADGICGRAVDLTVDITTLGSEPFSMRFSENESLYVSLSYDPKTQELTVDRTHAGRGVQMCDVRTFAVEGELTKLRLLLDRFSFELFVNDGAQTFTGTLYEMPEDAVGISFRAPGSTFRAACHQLTGINMNV